MDATVARGFMSDGTVMRYADIYTVVSGLDNDNIAQATSGAENI